MKKQKRTKVSVSDNRAGVDPSIYIDRLNPLWDCPVLHLSHYWWKIYHFEETHRGKTSAVALMKELYNVAVRYALEQPFDALPFRKSDKEGFPELLKKFKGLLSGSPKEKRAALTVLRQYESLRLSPKVSFDTIEAPTQKSGVYIERMGGERWKTFVRGFTKKFREEWSSQRRSVKNYASTKKGPNKVPSTFGAHFDAVALVQDPQVLMNLGNFSQAVYGSNDVPRIIDLAGIAPSAPSIHSRIVFLPDKGGKTRVVAIADHWTQRALKPVHNFLMDQLRSLPTDGTYKQNHVSSKTRSATRSRPSWCYDLTAATDLFPLEITSSVFEAIVGDTVASCWKALMVERNFYHPDRPKGVRYTKGNGMGFYTSWASFALTHHAVVQYAAYLEGFKEFFFDYCIIGDDIAIHHRGVAKRYRTLLDKLEVQISKAKSIVSEKPPFSAEIAKRLFFQGEEISPIPPGSIKSAQGEFLLFPSLIREITDRGHADLVSDAPAASQLAERFYKKSYDEVTALLHFPGRVGLRPVTGVTDLTGPWSAFNVEQVRKAFLKVRLRTMRKRISASIKRKKKFLLKFETEMRLGSGLPIDSSILRRHPLRVEWSLLVKSFMDFSNKILLRSARWSQLEDPEYIPDLFLKDYYIRKDQRRDIVLASLALETLRELNKDPTFGSEIIIKDEDDGKPKKGPSLSLGRKPGPKGGPSLGRDKPKGLGLSL